MKGQVRLVSTVLIVLALVAPLARTAAADVPGIAARTGALAPAAQREQPGVLSRHDAGLLQAARDQGAGKVNMLFAALPGAADELGSGLEGLGATIRYRDADIDYLRALVPIDKAQQAAGLPGVQAASLDELVPYGDEQPGADEMAALAPPGPGTPPLNPYLPTQDIGAPQFVASHPGYDGRGVKIAIVDGGVDLLTPELQTAKDVRGNPVRKVLDWVNFLDPLSEPDPSWVSMAGQIDVASGSFTVDGVTYTGVLADGSYRFGIFDEARIGPGSDYSIGCGPDINRNGLCNEKFAVLWSTGKELVWVDSNADRSFAGEKGMTDYRANHDLALFGNDNPATPARESVPFVVQIDGKDKYVNIGIVANAHGTHVAGIAAGKGFFGGAFDGAAPEAQLVSIRVCLFGNTCSLAAIVEGVIFAAKQANVDVINMSIGGLSALNDGNATEAITISRLVDRYKAQMFFSAGNNGPGINTVGDLSAAPRVMSVGGYVTKQSWEAIYGAPVASQAEGLLPLSSRGPREDGGSKPNLVAPAMALSCIPGWLTVRPLPPGYTVFSGTSMAAPQAAGGTALLISAAMHEGVQWKPAQLRQAVNSGARFLPAYGAHEQGNGLFQVGAAWEVLKQKIKVSDISSQAPVNTVLSASLAVPGQGPGIYEREGWSAGQTAQRTITLVRGSGGAKPVRYQLTWQGNDGAFASASSIDLALKQPAGLTVTVSPPASGVHSALLIVDDPDTPGIDYQVLNTVVAAEQFTPANNFSVSVTGHAERPDKATFFFSVPEGTPVLKLDLVGSHGEPLRMLRYQPDGMPLKDEITTAPYWPGLQTRSLPRPVPGVWEVTVETPPARPATPADFTLTATLLDGQQ